MLRLVLGSRFRTWKGTFVVTAVCWEHGSRTGVEFKPESVHKRDGIKPSFLPDALYALNYDKFQHLGE